MSNQSVDGFQGSEPFINDEEYNNLSMDELKLILEYEKEKLKKNYKDLSKKQKLIRDIKKLKRLNAKEEKGVDIKKKSKPKKIKTFDEYFQECIRDKKIPPDTLSYLREALERAVREYDQGLVKEKSAFENFAVKHIIEGDPDLTPVEYFNKIYAALKDFFTYHRNIKFSMILVCLMEQEILNRDKGVVRLKEDKAFKSGKYINLESTNVKKLIDLNVKKIIEDLEVFQKNGSGWYFKEVVNLEIHTVENRPMKGSSYIPLPGWISNKKAIVNIQNKDEKCFLWCILRYIHPKERDEERLVDLKKYENYFNTEGINFPMKLKHISKFEKLNPSLPGRNVFFS